MRHRIKLEITGELSAETLNSLRSNPNVESISEDGIVHTMATQYALSYANQFISDFLVTDLMRLGDWAVSARIPNSPVKIPGMFLSRHYAVSDVQFERSPFHSATNYQYIYPDCGGFGVDIYIVGASPPSNWSETVIDSKINFQKTLVSTSIMYIYAVRNLCTN